MKPTAVLRKDFNTLAGDVKVLVNATAASADETVTEARQRLSVVLNDARKTYGHVKEIATSTARAAGQGVRNHPYATIGAALAVGALISLCLTRRRH